MFKTGTHPALNDTQPFRGLLRVFSVELLVSIGLEASGWFPISTRDPIMKPPTPTNQD